MIIRAAHELRAAALATLAAIGALSAARAAAPAASGAVLLRPAQVWTAGEPAHSGWVEIGRAHV